MFASTTSATQVGVDARPVHVESHVASGAGGFGIVGLPDTAVRESQHRVRSAFANSGYRMPTGRVTVNLAPANLPKSGPSFDLPIALGLLASARAVPDAVTDVVSVGELALDGSVRSARGVLAAARVAHAMGRPLVVPRSDVADALLVAGVDVRPVGSLAGAVAAACGEFSPPEPVPVVPDAPTGDLADIRGQPTACRAAEIAAVGSHHLLLVGPPGAGKTMIATRLPALLPAPTDEERLEIASVWAASSRRDRPVGRPFRAPHHSASVPALLGGGSGMVEPGEVSLAHRGVLFLDELGEFPTHVLDGLRQPLEDGAVTIARRGVTVRYPASALVVAATNPCPCGYRDDRVKPCSCSDAHVARYRRKLSGPLVDRFDMAVRVGRPDGFDGPPADSSAVVQARVAEAVAFRRERPDRWSADATRMVDRALADGVLTGRGHERVRSVARTIADVALLAEVVADHVLEAMSLRTS